MTDSTVSAADTITTVDVPEAGTVDTADGITTHSVVGRVKVAAEVRGVRGRVHVREWEVCPREVFSAVELRALEIIMRHLPGTTLGTTRRLPVPVDRRAVK
jgi:hypothetical protein